MFHASTESHKWEFFLKPFHLSSKVEEGGLFFPGGKRRMGRVRGWSGSLRGFDYKPVPPNLTGMVTMATILWGPKGELGRGGGEPESGHKQISNAPRACAHR